jgi:ribonuclease P protein component
VPAKVGFVVGKAVGGAVVRNRVRRRLRHLVRERLAELPADSLLVVRALPATAETSYAELREDLGRCLGRVLSSTPSPRTAPAPSGRAARPKVRETSS